MGRRAKIREYDSFLEQYTVQEVKDDRGRASRVRSEKDLARLAKSQGVVSYQIKQMNLFEYAANNELKVKDAKVKSEAEQVKKEILNARFYPYEQQQKQYAEIAQESKVTQGQAKKLVSRDYAIRAKAILAAARAGDVKLDSYTVGILNGLEKGRYEHVVYGKKDSSGERRFSRGRFFNELGFGRAAKRTREGKGFVGTEAAKDEMRRNFIDISSANVAPSRSVGGTGNRFASSRFSQTARSAGGGQVKDNEKSDRDSRFDFARAAAARKKIEDEIPF